MSGLTTQVQVNVDSKGNVSCSPDPIPVKGANVLIQFKLVGEGWEFADKDAIVVDNPGSNFPYPSWTLKPQRAALLDADNSTGDFKYSVTVVETSSGRPVVFDPTIRNEG